MNKILTSVVVASAIATSAMAGWVSGKIEQVAVIAGTGVYVSINYTDSNNNARVAGKYIDSQNMTADELKSFLAMAMTAKTANLDVSLNNTCTGANNWCKIRLD